MVMPDYLIPLIGVLFVFAVYKVANMKETGINEDPDEQAPHSKGKKDKSIELLRQIRDNTSSTNTWVKIIGWPILAAAIVNVLQSCS